MNCCPCSYYGEFTDSSAMMLVVVEQSAILLPEILACLKNNCAGFVASVERFERTTPAQKAAAIYLCGSIITFRES